jgi:hypothetical protein
MKNRIGRPSVSVTACNFVFIPPFVRPIRRPRPLFFNRRLDAVRCALSLSSLQAAIAGQWIGRVDRDRLSIRCPSSQSCHDPSKNTHITSPLPAIVKCLARTILFRRITPPQPIAIDEDNTTEHAPVINARHTMALRKITAGGAPFDPRSASKDYS